MKQTDGSSYIEEGFTSMENAKERPLANEIAALVFLRVPYFLCVFRNLLRLLFFFLRIGGIRERRIHTIHKAA